MKLTRREFLSLVKENALSVLASGSLVGLATTMYLSDETRAQSSSQLNLSEQDVDKMMGFPGNMTTFHYVDGGSGKNIPIYAKNEQTYVKIKDALNYLNEKRPEKYHSIISKVEKIKATNIPPGNIQMPNSYAFMSVIPGENIIYINESLFDKFELSNETTGCAFFHEKTHLDIHGELRAQLAEYLCLIDV